MATQAHTFLFADLVGFTALAESEGDDRALEAVVALQRRVQGLLEQHSAEQVKALGDGLMLRCRDPRAAVRLGLRVVDDLAIQGGVPPVRVGIHTGPALSREGDWYGRTVNVAARLCAVAPGGEVMVSESTRSAAGAIPGVDWGERELHWLRNVSEPVGTYLVSGTPEPVSSQPAQRSQRPWYPCQRKLAREAMG
ncbi:MAG: adenylate/guanylate cyclase domain-containing protein [Solirubrobacterales bacterium]|nr:adenylate/guanylate cyclase domain-containing protein [Solirubrobacterales bacterium]